MRWYNLWTARPPKLELGDGLLNSVGVEADDILDQKFVNKKQQEDAVLEQIKDDYCPSPARFILW